MSRFVPEDFEQADHQLLARILIQSLEQDGMEASQYLVETMPETLQDTYRAYLEPFTEGEPTSQTGFELAFRTLLRLRKSRINENIEQIRFLSQDFQEQGRSAQESG